MKTWNDYKEYVKSINADEKKNMEEIEEMAAIVGALVQRRNALGLSQRELAARCGMPQSSIARIESCKTAPNLDTLLKVMGTLGLKLSVTTPEQPKATA